MSKSDHRDDTREDHEDGGDAIWAANPRDTLRARTAGPISTFDPGGKPGFDGDKEDGEEALVAVGERLAALQEKLYACGRSGDRRSILLVLQGMDTAGKGGIVRHVGGMMDPQGLSVRGFAKPTPEEASHDFLWRIHKALPAAGRIGIFDRSHYEDVLPVRVHQLVPESVWRPRYDLINEFEADQTAAGMTIVKCALVVSKDEQRARLTERLERPDKYWKYNPGDVDERGHWDAYLAAYQEIFDRTDTDAAPWYLVPADRKWYARLAIAQLLLDALESLDLSWPPADFDVEVEKRRVADMP